MRPTCRDSYHRSPLFNWIPAFLGKQSHPLLAAGLPGDLLGARLNLDVGAWLLSPMASEIEAADHSLGRRDHLIPSPAEVCLSAAATWRTSCAFLLLDRPMPVRMRVARGMDGTRLRVYCSNHRRIHGSESRRHCRLGHSARRSSYGSLRITRCGSTFHLCGNKFPTRPGSRRQAVSGRRHAGSVSTGAIHPLIELAELCREFSLRVPAWMGPMAAWLRFCPMPPPQLAGLRLADSVAGQIRIRGSMTLAGK